MMRMMRELAREELESVLKGGQPGVPKDKPIKKTRKRGRSDREPVLDLTRDRDLDEPSVRRVRVWCLLLLQRVGWRWPN